MPADWQEENLRSAENALDKVKDALYLIHDAWLDRNYEVASEEQKPPFSRLADTEKKKDIAVLLEAVKMIKDKPF